MQVRTYSLTLIFSAIGLFLAIIALNVILDPEEVLQTGLLGPAHNPNDRYTRMRVYLSASSSYDGLLFGSSRSAAISPDALSARMGNAKFAQFGIFGGQILDHQAVLEFVVRSKVEQGQALRSVFLLLDIDLFGQQPIANLTVQTLWHPVLTGESVGRFTWRYLTAFQPNAWRDQIEHGLSFPRTTVPPVSTENAVFTASIDEPTLPRAPENKHSIAERIIARPGFSRDLALLARFTALCRVNQIAFAVAFSPLHRENATQYDHYDLIEAAKQIATVVPVWDFDAPEWLSARADLWFDKSHFKPEVANMMLDRMFGGETSGAPQGFGVLRQN